MKRIKHLNLTIDGKTISWHGWQATVMSCVVMVIITVKTWLGHYSKVTYTKE